MTSALTLVALAVAAAAPAAPAAKEKDVVLQALNDEIARARGLKMESLDSPYYVSAYSNDSEGFNVSASFGALVNKGGDTRRTLNVSVRVGTPELDNTEFQEQGGFQGGAVPVDADYNALRQALWFRFDGAYKQAVEALARKRAYLETEDVKDRPADFGPATLATVLQPREKLVVDRERWTRLVKRASAVFRDHPVVYAGTATFHADVSHQYFASTDPAQHRFGETRAELSLTAFTQAPDGMELHVRWESAGRSDADLPKDEEVVQAARDVAARLEALAKAPVLSEDYTGPVLLTGRAAAQFFLDTVAEPLSVPREPLGSARSGRLVDRLGKHIASKLLTVRDDPNQKAWHGKPLLGYFPVDDDGVKPQPITLVEKGILKTYYMSRVPTRLIKDTNGHSRAGFGQTGNLFVEGAEPTSREALKKRLIALAKEDDQDFGLLIEELEESPGGRFFAGGTLSLPSPTVAYRVYTDGREELVRGLSFKPVSFRVLKDIVAMGSDATLVNTQQMGQHVSVVAPSVLVKELEVKRPKDEFEKPPFSPRPQLSASSQR
jgi:TldD protein